MLSLRRASLAGALIISCGPQLLSQNLEWLTRGPGGGGALYSPSINPSNNDEFYVGCDMSGLYYSTNFGLSYGMLDFRRIQGGHDSRVQFTADRNILYCINYANDLAVPVRSTDGGRTWVTLPGNPDPTEATYTIFADYNNPGRVIISYYGSIQASTDGGATFTNIHTARNPGAGITVGGALFDGNSIYLGTSEGLLVSANGGVSFSLVPVSGLGAGERIFSFAGARQGSVLRFYCLTADSNSIYVGIPGSDYWGFMKGVYSLDYGSTGWISRMNGITPGTDFPMYVATAQSDTSIVYLGGSNSSGAPNIMKSADGGRSWAHVFLSTNNQNIATGWSGDGGDRGWGYGECVFGLGVAPNNAQRVLFTDFGFVHKTTDGGASWEQAYLTAEDQNAAGVRTPQGRYYHSIGLEVTSCWQVFWSDSANMFAGYSDIKGIRSTDGGNSWSFDYSGHSANTMYRIVQDPVGGTLYAGTSNIHDMYQSTRLQDNLLDASDPGGKIIFSTDKGAHWSDLHLFGHPVFWLALDPNNQDRLYASVIHSTSGGVFVTNDLHNGSSSSWTKLPNPPRTEGHPASIVVLNDGSVVCTYSGRRTASGFTASSGVFFYSPGSNSWSDVSDPGMRYWTKDITVDPNDPLQNTWYVGVFSGWGGPPNGLGGLYRTSNRGAAWGKINALDRVTSCTISPANPSEMYLTTETNGLWRTISLNTPSPVFTLEASYPFRQPERVFFNPFDRGEIWVSSFGGGMRVGTVAPVGIHDHPQASALEFRLDQNYPNPFNPTTVFSYHLPVGPAGLPVVRDVRLVVYDLLGREVAVLVNERKATGTYEVRFEASGLASGVYIYRLTTGDFVQTRKMILVR
jgi:photosystem II stability/assembly factor-like uncharacterized protein